MRKILLIVVYLIQSFWISAQEESISYFLRDYKSNFVIGLSSQENSQILFDQYGNLIHKAGVKLQVYRYTYQDQEYESNLGLYLFPRRIYHPKDIRFFQPDPLSQYASPYLFVGADPVNYIDQMGLAGKPIVLYHNYHSVPNSIDPLTLDMMEQGGDAYYISMSDFLKDQIPADLSEFNGNIFINSHMSIEDDRTYVRVESAEKKDFGKMGEYPGKAFRMESEKAASISIEGENFGNELRNMVEKRNLDVKRIVAGGCRGEGAARDIGRGFSARPSADGKILRTFGLDRNQIFLSRGNQGMKSIGYKPVGETRLYTVPHGKPWEVEPTAASASEKEKTFQRFKYKVSSSPETWESPVTEVSGREYRQLIQDARVPSSLSRNFKTFVFTY